MEMLELAISTRHSSLHPHPVKDFRYISIHNFPLPVGEGGTNYAVTPLVVRVRVRRNPTSLSLR
jgi:hypothetical protein